MRIGETEEDLGELGFAEEVGQEFHRVGSDAGDVLVEIRGGGGGVLGSEGADAVLDEFGDLGADFEAWERGGGWGELGVVGRNARGRGGWRGLTNRGAGPRTVAVLRRRAGPRSRSLCRRRSHLLSVVLAPVRPCRLLRGLRRLDSARPNPSSRG